MSRKDELQQQIEAFEKQIEPLEEELNQLIVSERKIAQQRILLANQGRGDFKLDELTFAAFSRCDCGAGLAYPPNAGLWGSWMCSDILLGRAIPANKEGAKTHIDGYPFSMYEIKSENQTSANGMTTRPSE